MRRTLLKPTVYNQHIKFELRLPQCFYLAFRRSQTICQMFHSVISYFIHAEIQLLEFQGPSQGRGQEFTGMRGYSTARQPYDLQPAVLVTQPLHKLLDSIVTDGVVSEVQLPQVGLFCAQDCR